VRGRDDSEALLRAAAPRALAVLTRRFGDFAGAEDAMQEAMLEASSQWPAQGPPENPVGWLIHVASRRLSDRLRSESARRRREEKAAAQEPPAAMAGPAEVVPEGDDSLALIFMCCHPALSPASAIALTLRAVGGLSTTEIAAAFLVPEATMRSGSAAPSRRSRTRGPSSRCRPGRSVSSGCARSCTSST
jgi:RNA polymerase sigma factor (sigma-70 family)